MPSDIYDFPVLGDRDHVSMHLLVLSAFQQVKMTSNDSSFTLSQCTFWCSVLSDDGVGFSCSACHGVSMHLLVLSAFRHSTSTLPSSRSSGLNAPSGAQCFPAQLKSHYKDDWETSLNAPSGAQCFPTYWALDLTGPFAKKSQCTFWCSVLSDGPYTRGFGFEFYQESQCTFWCSVLSDGLTDGWTALPVVIRLNAPSGAQCFPTARMGQRIRAHHVSMHLLVLSAFRLALNI